MSHLNIPSTPRKNTAFDPATPTSTSRITGSPGVHASPHYTTTRRHSLYGTEDRIIVDPGSRIWKVGFSGEGRPRDVFYAGGSTGESLWKLSRATNPADREEEDRILQAKIQHILRSVFHDSLLTDPKSRKVILIEHPLLPLYVKDMIARALFSNLQVPSISFASSHLLSLLTVGRITGIVLDCGHLESTALPIFASRPLYPQLKATPLAGSRLSSHIRDLILLFGTYLPPATSLMAANIPAASRSTRVPMEVLTESVIEDIKTRCCFVGDALDSAGDPHIMTPGIGDEHSSDLDIPPSDSAHSESDYSHVSMDVDSAAGGSQAASSSFSVVSHSQANLPSERKERGSEGNLQILADMYMRYSTASDIKLRVVPPASQQAGTGRGTLIIPGWIRERAAEVLFEGGDVDESSVAEIILDSLLKVPVDLRKTLSSSILVVGGTPMLPGFIPRLHTEILRALAPPSPTTPPSISRRPRKVPKPAFDRYAALRPLTSHFAILNNPSPPHSSNSTTTPTTPTIKGFLNAGKAPAFTPACMPWVGGSLAGALKTGGSEISREKWDEADAREEDAENSIPVDPSCAPGVYNPVLPDWTRSPLPVGAPYVVMPHAPVVGA